MALAEYDVTRSIALIHKGAVTPLNAADVSAALYPPLQTKARRLGASSPEDLVQDTLVYLIGRPDLTFPNFLALLGYAEECMEHLLIDQIRKDDRSIATVAYDEAQAIKDDLDRCQVCGSFESRCPCCG